MDKHGDLIHKGERCRVTSSQHSSFTRVGNKLYVHVHFWPGSTVAVGGLQNKVLSAKLLPSGKEIKVVQDDFRVQFTGLPERAPEPLVSVIEAVCDGEPKQDNLHTRNDRPRRGVGV